MPLLPPTAAPAAAVATLPAVQVRLPDEDVVDELLSGLLDRKVTVVRDFGEFAMPTAGEYSTFIDDTGVLAAIAIADLGFVAHSGASLALIPAGQSEAAIAAGEVTEALRENFYEVVNIMSSLLNADPSCHVKLKAIHAIGGDDVPVEASNLASSRSKAHWFNVDIAGYGTGTFAFFAV